MDEKLDELSNVIYKVINEYNESIKNKAYSSTRFIDFDNNLRTNGILLSDKDDELDCNKINFFPELKLFSDYFNEIKKIDNTLTNFAFLDYYIPPNKYNAVYHIRDDVTSQYQIYAERLNLVYKDMRVIEKIFDSNKVMQFMNYFYPFVISKEESDLNENIIGYKVKITKEFLIVFNEIINENGNNNDVDKILKFYKEFSDKNSISDFLINSISNQSSHKIKEFIGKSYFKNSDLVGGINFINIKAAFLTYLAFVLLITPEDWKEYIYFPTCLVTRPTNQLSWVGGILLAFTKETNQIKRTIYYSASHHILSAFYLGFTHSLLLEKLKYIAVLSIMIRNFSHHHTSHVTPKIELNLKELINELKAKINNVKNNNNLIELNKKISELENKNQTLDSIIKYIHYLEGKMGFLNIINVYDPQPEGRINLYDAIDFLRIDPGAKFFKEKFAQASNRKSIIVCDIVNKNKIPEPIVSPGYGELGIHGFYIIFENYARNLLKYCRPISNGDDPKIEFELIDETKFIRVEIKTNNYFLYDNDNKKFGDARFANQRCNFINGILYSEELIYPDGKVNFDNAGIKEMRICANILVGKFPGGIEKNTIKCTYQMHNNNSSLYYSLKYEFIIPKANYIYTINNTDDFDKLKKGEVPKPDFLVIKKEMYNQVLADFGVLPQRLVWLDNKSNSDNNEWIEWLKNRSILIGKLNGTTEKENYAEILEKWYKEVLKNQIEVNIVGLIDEKNNDFIKIFNQNSTNNNVKIIEFNHDEKNGVSNNTIALNFSNNSSYRLYRYYSRYIDKNENVNIIKYEILSTLAFNILIIDHEIYNKVKEKHSSDLDVLKNIGLEIIDENFVEDISAQELKYNSGNILKLDSFHCIVFHLGMLDKGIWKKIFDINFSIPYIRIVSGRVKPLPEDIVKGCLWARSRIIDRTLFLNAFEMEDLFEIKYRITNGVLV